MDHSSEPATKERSERVMSHALVELRRSNWWPFGVKSAVLLDLSQTGFKIELTGPADIELESVLLLTIPLRPFGVASPPSIQISVQVKWFQNTKQRLGGTFVNVNPSDKLFLDTIIAFVQEQPIS